MTMFNVGDKVRRTSGGGVLGHEGIVTKVFPNADSGRGGIVIDPPMAYRRNVVLNSQCFELVEAVKPTVTVPSITEREARNKYPIVTANVFS